MKKVWTCPRCKTKNEYFGKVVFGFFEVDKKTAFCKKCSLNRFSEEYYSKKK